MRRALVLTVVALATGCGGKVVVDLGAGSTSGTGGAGGAGSTSNATTGPGTSTSTGIVDAGGPDAEYAGYQLFTDVPRYAVAKTEVSLSRCTWLIVAAGGGSFGLNVQTTMGWNVEAAFITNDVGDCKQPGNFPTPAGAAAKPVSGVGTLKQDSTSFPCFVDVHVDLTFPSTYPWVPATEALDVDQLLIQGSGCGG
jgi:hypothetical protein